jgi:hypothetical protein
MIDDIELEKFAKAASMDGAAIASAVLAALPTEKADFVDKTVQPALERLKARLGDGDKRALLQAMAICFGVEIAVPSWLSEAFLEAYYSVPKAWNDVFDRPIPKGKGTEAARRHRKIRFKLYNSVEERHARGEAKDNELFAAVGRDFGISRSAAYRHYEKFCDEFKGRDLQHPYLKSVVRSLSPDQTAPINDPPGPVKRSRRGRRSGPYRSVAVVATNGQRSRR